MNWLTDFLTENREWLFSGAGVAMVAAMARVVWLLWEERTSRAGEHPRLPSPHNIPVTQQDVDSNPAEDASSTSVQEHASEQRTTFDTDRCCVTHAIEVGDYVSVKVDEYLHARVEVVGIEEIEVERVGRRATESAARLRVSTGGGISWGGDHTQKVNVNEFLVPVVESQEPERSVFRFFHSEDHTTHMSITVHHINPNRGRVEVRVVLLRVRVRNGYNNAM